MTLNRSLIFLTLLAALSGCGTKGPLYLPPDPNDSYLSRIGAQINDLTNSDMVSAPPAGPAEKARKADEAVDKELGARKSPAAESSEATEPQKANGTQNPTASK